MLGARRAAECERERRHLAGAARLSWRLCTFSFRAMPGAWRSRTYRRQKSLQIRREFVSILGALRAQSKLPGTIAPPIEASPGPATLPSGNAIRRPASCSSSIRRSRLRAATSGPAPAPDVTSGTSAAAGPKQSGSISAGSSFRPDRASSGSSCSIVIRSATARRPSSAAHSCFDACSNISPGNRRQLMPSTVQFFRGNLRLQGSLASVCGAARQGDR